MSRLSVPASFWFSLSERGGAVDYAVRVSDRSFTGWVVEPVFASFESASDFARRAAQVVGVGIAIRRWVPPVHSAYGLWGVTVFDCWACSVPCEAPGAELSLGQASRGSRAIIRP
jgi:hypothetical protein